MSDNEAFVTELLSAQIASLNTENGALRAEIDRLRVRCRQIDDEAYDYAEQIEQLKAEIDRLRAAAKDSVDHYADARAEIDRLRRILAALREPSEGTLMAVLTAIYTRATLTDIIHAAVAAAEQEVGRE